METNNIETEINDENNKIDIESKLNIITTITERYSITNYHTKNDQLEIDKTEIDFLLNYYYCSIKI